MRRGAIFASRRKKKGKSSKKKQKRKKREKIRIYQERFGGSKKALTFALPIKKGKLFGKKKRSGLRKINLVVQKKLLLLQPQTKISSTEIRD